MIYAGDRQRMLAKLISACCDLEDALTQSAPGARYDPVVIPQGLRNELAVVRDGLARVIRRLEEHPDAGRVKGLPPPLPRWFHNATSSIARYDAGKILCELHMARNFCSSLSVIVIQYGIPLVSRRAWSRPCSIQ